MYKTALLAILSVSAFAGAQQVTVGSLSSTQDGVTTTITVPVSVAMPASTGNAVSGTYAGLDAEAGTGKGTDVIQTWSPCRRIHDRHPAHRRNRHSHRLEPNLQRLRGSHHRCLPHHPRPIRLTDNAAAGINYGMGVGSTNADSPTFTWSTTAGVRNSFTNTRIAYLTAGTSINLFVYVDSSKGLGLAGAALNIKQIP